MDQGSYFSKIMIWSSRGRGGERMIFQELGVVLMDSCSENCYGFKVDDCGERERTQTPEIVDNDTSGRDLSLGQVKVTKARSGGVT